MPTARLGPQDQIPQSRELTPGINEPRYHSTLIDTSVTPVQRIITQTGGYPLIVDYYAQNLGRDQDVDGYNPDLNSPIQQYTRIRNVKLKLSSPMNYAMVAGNSIDTYQGDGKLMIPGIIPKQGDVFLADIGQGRLGMFTLANPLALSQYQNTTYQFDFSLTNDATADFVATLDARVTRRLNYVQDMTGTGGGPLLTDDALNTLNNAQSILNTTIKQYMAESFSNDNSTLTLPGQYSQCYDPYLTNFVLNLIEVEAHPLIRKIRRPNVDDHRTLEFIDIFSVLLDRDVSMLPLCFTQATLRPTSDYIHNKQAGSIAYGSFDNVVFPRQPINGPHSLDWDVDTGYLGETIRNPVANTLTLEGIPLLDTIGGHGGTGINYVFAPSFYDGSNTDESMLTMLVRSYLEGDQVDPNLLMQIIATRLQWCPIDRFYYTPILIMLLRAVLIQA